MMTAISFSRQNNAAGSRACTLIYVWNNVVVTFVLVLESKGLSLVCCVKPLYNTCTLTLCIKEVWKVPALGPLGVGNLRRYVRGVVMVTRYHVPRGSLQGGFRVHVLKG